MKIVVTIEKRHFFILLISIMLLAGMIAVVAYENPPIWPGNPAEFGHSVNELDWDQTIEENINIKGIPGSNGNIIIGPNGINLNLNPIGGVPDPNGLNSRNAVPVVWAENRYVKSEQIKAGQAFLENGCDGLPACFVNVDVPGLNPNGSIFPMCTVGIIAPANPEWGHITCIIKEINTNEVRVQIDSGTMQQDAGISGPINVYIMAFKA